MAEEEKKTDLILKLYLPNYLVKKLLTIAESGMGYQNVLFHIEGIERPLGPMLIENCDKVCFEATSRTVKMLDVLISHDFLSRVERVSLVEEK